MHYRNLGRTGTRVSEICLGAMTFGKNQWGVGQLDVKAATEFVDVAFEAGVNFFDTADIYAYGESEEVLGQTLKGRRDKAVIATKCRIKMSDDVNDVGLSRRHIILSCERSLKRLGTDRIDLYQVHGWDRRTPLEESLEALDHLVRQGKALYVGASNWAAWQLAKAVGLQERNGWARFATLQPYYSLIGRDIEVEVVPFCLDAGLGILPWSPLAGGYLSGKYRRGDAGRLAGHIGEFIPVDAARADRVLDSLESIAAARGCSVAQAALAWLKEKSGVTSVIIGARTLDQLKQNIGAKDVGLTDEEKARLDEASATPPPYPQWMIEHQRRESE
jgi:aryl-alcohol dehydrogenase-like predicted oxidoreductase